MTVLVTGSAGRVGSALRAAWQDQARVGQPVLWHRRQPSERPDIVWNIGHGPAPDLPTGLILLHLAGVTRGTAAQLAENRLATAAICQMAVDRRARHVFLMSSAAVYRPIAGLISEADPPDPESVYGRAKHEAEQAAEAILTGPDSPGLTILRLANLAGADALFAACVPGQTVTLDPVPGQAQGPVRSYIGPRALARVLAHLVQLAAEGMVLPRILNLAQSPVVAMGDLLDARGQPWRFGPPRSATVARVAVATDRLDALLPLPPATPAGLIADLDGLPGHRP